MTSELTRLPPTGQSADDRFVLPARTTARFALLVFAVLTSSMAVYQMIYLVLPGHNFIAAVRGCSSAPLTCAAAFDRTEAWWILAGLAGITVLTAVIYLLLPWWTRRRMALTALPGNSVALAKQLESLRERAGVRRVRWLMQPGNLGVSAFAFGLPSSRMVALSGGAVVAVGRQDTRGDVDVVVLHELAHIRNRDIDQTHLAIAAWWAFVVAAVAPMLFVICFIWKPPADPQPLWRAVALALLVYLLRNRVLRVREFDADARVRRFDPQAGLASVLAARATTQDATVAGTGIARAARLVRGLSRVHPTYRARAAALADSAPLDRYGFWDGLAIGLVAAIGATNLQDFRDLSTATDPFGGYSAALPSALLAGTALAVIVWRGRLAGALGEWRAGTGLGLGLGLGPVMTLFGLGIPNLAPNSLGWVPVASLAGWVGGCVVVAACVPSWIGYWADAWQLTRNGNRAAARIGLSVAAAGAVAVLFAALAATLAAISVFSAGASATVGWRVLGQLTSALITSAGSIAGAWVVPVIVLAVTVAAWLRSLARRGPRVSADAWRLLVIALAGCLGAIAVMLAFDAAVHSDVAEAVRLNTGFLPRFSAAAEVICIGVGAVFALVAAAALRTSRVVPTALAVAAVTAAVAETTYSNTGRIGDCLAMFSVGYTQPAGACHPLPTLNIPSLWQAAAGAALCSVIVVPAGFAASRWAAGRWRVGRHTRHRVLAVPAGWAASLVVFAATVAGITQVATVSVANGIAPVSTAAVDGTTAGWAVGPGWKLRLPQGWQQVAAIGSDAMDAGDAAVPGGGAATLVVETGPYGPGPKAFRASIVSLGARPATFGGTMGLCDTQTYLTWQEHDCYVLRGQETYAVFFRVSTAAIPAVGPDFTRMLDTWTWTGS
jgi:Zn-dependent protease with chaperone function